MSSKEERFGSANYYLRQPEASSQRKSRGKTASAYRVPSAGENIKWQTLRGKIVTASGQTWLKAEPWRQKTAGETDNWLSGIFSPAAAKLADSAYQARMTI